MIRALVLCCLTLPAIGFAQSPIDLSTWSSETLDLSSSPQGDWAIAADNASVIQLNNADPTFFLNDTSQSAYQIRGTWSVVTTDDDDFIGFVFGYADPAHTYVFDWKRTAQNQASWGLADEGFAVRRIAAPDVGSLEAPDFWRSAGTTQATVLDAQFGPGRGWDHGVDYTFELIFDRGNFTIRVFEGQVQLWQSTVQDGTYAEGRFGFYNYSQKQVRYSGFVQNEAPVCEAGGPYAGTAGQAIQFDGSGSTDPDGSIVFFAWDFGDGATGTGATPSHTYANNGSYVVELCVTDDSGATACCRSAEPALPIRGVNWGVLRSLYRGAEAKR